MPLSPHPSSIPVSFVPSVVIGFCSPLLPASASSPLHPLTTRFPPLPQRHSRVRTSFFGAALRPPRIRVSTAPRWAAMLGGGGILGVGPSEMAVILAVGWFILGPSKLFSLSRDIGKLVGDLRRSADEARTTFTEALEVEVADMERAEKEGGTLAPEQQRVGETATGADTEGEEEEEDDDEQEVVRRVAVPDRTTAATGDGDVPDIAESDADGAAAADVMGRQRFLEQLHRAEDPTQTADPTLEWVTGGTQMETGVEEEELEVARLEYELAKARLAAKQRRQAAQVEQPLPNSEKST